MNKKKLKEILNDEQKVFHVKRDNSEDIVDKYFIKKLRLDLGYTQTVFSTILGVSVKTIEKWEQGAVNPRNLVKKFLFLLDKHPVLLDDLYSFESHENFNVKREFVFNNVTSFSSLFIEHGFKLNSDDSYKKDISRGFARTMKSNDFDLKNCCPAS